MRRGWVIVALQLAPTLLGAQSGPGRTFPSPEVATLAALELDFREPHVRIALVDTVVRALAYPGPFNPSRFPSPARLSAGDVTALSSRWRFVPSGYDDSGSNTDTTRIVLARVASCAPGQAENCARTVAWVGGRPFGRNYYAWVELQRINNGWKVVRITYSEE